MRTNPLIPALPAILATLALVLPADAGGPCTTYGAGVTLERPTPLAAIVAAPEEWAGETVRVEGEVREVCPKAGCWLEIVPAPDAAALRVKVEDGEIVFPLSTRGRRATAQGTVEVSDLTREEYVAWQEHLAEELGKTFDPAAVGDGPYRWVQVKATGAEVCEGGSAATASGS
jgi:hypothetical protein